MVPVLREADRTTAAEAALDIEVPSEINSTKW